MLSMTRFTKAKWSSRPFVIALLYAASWSLLLTLWSIIDLSSQLQPIPDGFIQTHTTDVIYSVLRLSLWILLVSCMMGYFGILAYLGIEILRNKQGRTRNKHLAAVAAIVVISLYQFLWHLLYMPGSIMASYNLSETTLYPIWNLLSPETLSIFGRLTTVILVTPITLALFKLIRRQEWHTTFSFMLPAAIIATTVTMAVWSQEPSAPEQVRQQEKFPNILIIGTNSLTSDRLGINGYENKITPNIDSLATSGLNFVNVHTPTGIKTKPESKQSRTHAATPNIFSSSIFQDAGYKTVAIADIDLEDTLLPGPRSMRLFLSLFTNNRLGKFLLPDLYYLPGISLVEQKGLDTRKTIYKLSRSSQPFFISLYISGTQPHFSSNYPYYNIFTAPDYSGPHKFGIFQQPVGNTPNTNPPRPTTTKSQSQINNLYDGTIRLFDSEVGRIIDYLKQGGLLESTIVVIFGYTNLDHEQPGSNKPGTTHPTPVVIYSQALIQPKQLSQKISINDIIPTLLDLVGIERPKGMAGRSLRDITE